VRTLELFCVVQAQPQPFNLIGQHDDVWLWEHTFIWAVAQTSTRFDGTKVPKLDSFFYKLSLICFASLLLTTLI
jgi:hypothetical protein